MPAPSLTQRVETWRRRALGRPRTAIAYRRILVPVLDNPESRKAVEVACRLAGERRTLLAAITVIEVPELLPLDAHMIEEEEDARRLLDRVEAAGESYGIAVSTGILRAREAATAIVDKAEAIDAEIVVIGSTRSGRAPVFGRTVREVLSKAPCRVMVLASSPEGPSPRQGVTRPSDLRQAGA